LPKALIEIRERRMGDQGEWEVKALEEEREG
jgi:hypothetical protein